MLENIGNHGEDGPKLLRRHYRNKCCHWQCSSVKAIYTKVGTNCFNTLCIASVNISYSNDIAGVWDRLLFSMITKI